MSFSEAKPENDQEFETVLAETFGPPPRADIDAWRKRYPSALAWLNPQRISDVTTKRKRRNRIILLTITVALAICVWLGIDISHSTVNGAGAAAFAGTFEQIVNQIDNAPTVTWKSTDYTLATSRDGKRTWLVKSTSSNIYQSPGLWRKVNENGILVADRADGTSITLYPEKKQATITERQALTAEQLRVGPFQQFQKILKEGSLQWLEKRTLSTGDVVNVFRNTERDEDNKCYRSCDLWIDTKSKRLVAINFNGPRGELYDPEKDPIRNNPAGNDASSWKLLGCVWHDIDFEAKVDDSLFNLQPPEGYTVKHEQRVLRMTEQNMLEYLGVFVEFHGQTFPDEALPRYQNLDKLNAAFLKPVSKLTAIEKKYLALFDRYHGFGISNPFEFFEVSPDVAGKSFRYLGKGVKLGDKDRIVCWYKLKDAKEPNTYRVVHGDLSVKDVAVKDLPLPVDP